MKKFTALFMVIIIVLTFSACKKEKQPKNTETENKPKVEEITSLAVDENIAIQYYAATKEIIPLHFSSEASSLGGGYVELTQNDLECYMADVTGDKINDLIVTVGAVYRVYTMKNGYPKCIYNAYTGIMATETSLVEYKGDYYTKCASGSSTTGMTVSLVQHIDGEEVTYAESREVYDEKYEIIGYEMNGKMVSEKEYEEFNKAVENHVEYYPASKLLEKSATIKPIKDSKINYEKVYKEFVNRYEEEIGAKTGLITHLDMEYINAEPYKAEEGFVTHIVKDFNSDGVDDIITVQEVEDNSTDFAESNSSLYIKAYTVANEKIICMDAYYLKSVLPLFSYVDITTKDKLLMVSNIGAWLGDPAYNEHYIISISGTHFVVEYLDSMSVYSWDGDEEETANIKKAIKKLGSYGFTYAMDDALGHCDKDAQRLALYTMFGKDGRSSEYFENSITEKSGFYNYNKIS